MSKILKSVFSLTILLYSFNINAIEMDSSFVEGIDDLPLHEKMQVIKESLVLFDTYKGKLVEVKISGETDISIIRDFYSDILPNLGWMKKSNNKYIRGNDILSIEYSNNNIGSTVKFELIEK